MHGIIILKKEIIIKIKEVYKSKKVIFTDSKPGKSKFFDGFENLNNASTRKSQKIY